MTMLIELDSDNRASLRRLFDRYPCLHGSVAAVIEGGMGRVFADSQEEPHVALAVLDFHFLAGDPLHANAPLLFKLLQPGDVVIAPTPAWQHLVAATYPSELAVYHREAFQAEQFDIDKLRRFCQALPSGFALRQVRREEVTQLAMDLDPALVYNFRSHEEFITRAVGHGHPASGQVCLWRCRRGGWGREDRDRDSDPPSVSPPWVGPRCRGSPDTVLPGARDRSVLGCGKRALCSLGATTGVSLDREIRGLPTKTAGMSFTCPRSSF